MSASCVAPERPVRQRLFPLHLAPIESFMLADDQADYPMTFVVELTLTGQLHPPSWRAAVGEALERHPLLQAVVEPGKGGLPCWRAAADRAPLVDIGPEGAALDLPCGERLDLSRDVGLRVWVRQGPERVRVLLQFHHACADGTGAYRFIGDLLAAYGRRTAGTKEPPELVPMRPELLRQRARRAVAVAPLGARRLTPLALRQAWRILVPRPASLAAPCRPQTTIPRSDSFPGFVSLSLARDEHQRFRDAAGRAGVTPNDLLLRDLFLALARWNEEADHAGRWLRVMMPTDLREGEDIEMPCTNLTSYVFLTRRSAACRRPDALLHSIASETARVKRERLGTVFMDTIHGATHLRGLMPFLLRRNLCLATAVLSNAADPSRRFTARFPRRAGRLVCGNLLLEDITGVPPLRCQTRATFSISQYERRLTVSLRCDPYLFRRADTAAVLDRYVGRIRASAGLADPPPCGGDDAGVGMRREAVALAMPPVA